MLKSNNNWNQRFSEWNNSWKTPKKIEPVSVSKKMIWKEFPLEPSIFAINANSYVLNLNVIMEINKSYSSHTIKNYGTSKHIAVSNRDIIFTSIDFQELTPCKITFSLELKTILECILVAFILFAAFEQVDISSMKVMFSSGINRFNFRTP